MGINIIYPLIIKAAGEIIMWEREKFWDENKVQKVQVGKNIIGIYTHL